MSTQQEIEHYTAYMKMYGSMICDLASSEEYIVRLIENVGLNEFEQSLRKVICGHRLG